MKLKLVVIFLTADVSHFSFHFNLCVQIFTLLDFFNHCYHYSCVTLQLTLVIIKGKSDTCRISFTKCVYY